MGNSKRFTRNQRSSILAGVCSGIADYFNLNAFWIRLAFIVATFTWPLSIAVYFVLYFCMDTRQAGVRGAVNGITNSRMGRHFRHINYKKSLVKNKNRGRISGVCAGIADYLEINTFFVRLGFVAALMFGPLPIIAYIIGALLMDDAPRSRRAGRGNSRSNSRNNSRNNSHTNNRTNSYENSRNSRHSKKRQHEWAEEADFNDLEDDAFTTKNAKSYKDEIAATRQSARRERVRETIKRSEDDLSSVDQKFNNLEDKLRNLEATITSKKFKLHNEFKRM